MHHNDVEIKIKPLKTLMRRDLLCRSHSDSNIHTAIMAEVSYDLIKSKSAKQFSRTVT